MIPLNVASDIEGSPESERERVITIGELRQIWSASDELGYPFGPIIKLLILTAQRRSEVAEMRWSEVDGTAWRLPDTRAKRGKGHLISLPTIAARLVEGMPRVGNTVDLVFSTGRRRAQKGNFEELLLPAPVAGWSRAKARLDKIIAFRHAEHLRENLDLKLHSLQPWTLHDIRRSVATHLRDADVMGENRVDRLIVSKILNHAEGGMTRVYDRYSADPEQKRALQAWSDRVEMFANETSDKD